MTNTVLPAATEKLTDAEILKTAANVKNSLLEGAIGIGAPIGYLPKSNPLSFFLFFFFLIKQIYNGKLPGNDLLKKVLKNTVTKGEL